MRKIWIFLALLTFAGLLIFTACAKKGEQASSEKEAKQATAATPIDPSTVASISGTIKFNGAVPKPVKIDTSQDPTCKTEVRTETAMVDNGNLQNVFVYVKDGLGGRTFETPKDPVTLDQHNCHYVPHVLGVMAGQTIKILNSDPTTHNIHPTPKANREWNESQPPKGAALEKTFARPEIMLPVKCNQHPWMKMWINVNKSPFFAVTDKSGKFEIKELPPGTYTIAAVHEKYGEQTQKVTVAPKESKTADFNFKAGAAGGAGSQ